MMTGRTIRIFLADGEPTGILLAEIGNWTGKVLVAPRSRLDHLKRRRSGAPASTCSSVPTRTTRRGRWSTSARAKRPQAPAPQQERGRKTSGSRNRHREQGREPHQIPRLS